jgi:hypothetical protein
MTSLSEVERERLATGSRKIAAMFEPARFAEGLKAAAQLAVNSARSSPTLVQRLLLTMLLRR